MRANQFLTESIERSIIQEAQMSAQDVANVFKQTEKTMTDAGGNRTAVGMGKDVASAVNSAINKVGKWLQNTKPVQNFDQKFENLKSDIASQNPKLANAVAKLGAYAKKNPGKTAAVVGILTTISAVLGGPAGGAIAGQILRGSVELLKGEKLSTAVGKGAKIAALGYGIGQVADMVKDFMPSAAQPQVSSGGTDGGSVSYIPPETIDGGMWDGVTKEIKDNILAKYPESQGYTFKNDGETLLVYNAQGGKQAMISYDAMYDHARAMALGQIADSVILTTAQVNQLFEHIQNEGVGDYIKGKWDAAKGAVANKVATVGKNITTKVTADKLYKAWVKAGQPDDSGEVIQVLKQLGVKDEYIKSAFDSLGFNSQYQDGLNNIEKGFSDASEEFPYQDEKLPFLIGKINDQELKKMIDAARAPNAPSEYKRKVAALLAKRKEQKANQAKKDQAQAVKQDIQTA